MSVLLFNMKKPEACCRPIPDTNGITDACPFLRRSLYCGRRCILQEHPEDQKTYEMIYDGCPLIDAAPLVELICDRCHWPYVYADSETMFAEKCDICPINRFVEEHGGGSP